MATIYGLSCGIEPDLASDLIAFTKEITSDELNAGDVILYTASTGAQYRIVNLWIGAEGVNFSGGDGDLSITDGVINYSVIPSATLLNCTVCNTAWGFDNSLPYPSGNSLLRPTAADANLVASLINGTQYSAGTIVLGVLLHKITAGE